MSAIARFLVEFEPSPAASPGRRLSVALCVAGSTAIRSRISTGRLRLAIGAGTSTSNRTARSGSPRRSRPEPSGRRRRSRKRSRPAAEAAFSERIATLEEEHARARADDRARWVQDRRFRPWPRGSGRPTAEIEDHIGDAVAAVLEPLMADVVKGAALRELRQTIATLTAGGSTAKIEVTGPEDLVEAVRTSLDAAGADTSGMAFASSQEPK